MKHRWQRVRSIFERALALEGAARESWVREACGDDAGLLDEVRSMLRADGGADSFIDADARAALGEEADAQPDAESIGPYSLLEKLGAGGMGEVWLADQARPVRRQVALKIIRPGMDSSSVLARFDAERQALARMDHPAIARVYDAGTTPRGRPYFVMEHIRGLPITTHCDRERLTTAQRLDLMIRVCEGVQHAHQRGIIHRDLKPSNVLVTVEDERAAPKIIDFGIAKATDGRLTDHTLHTVLGELVGTPEYMSPEQADLTSQDIDVRTDVYALGVLLYELLTGTLPFDSRDLRQQSFDEIRRRIREDDPPTPSTRFRTLGGDLLTSTARARQTDPARLRKELQGDLDWIVMRALEKERDRRYGSAAELAADIRRHLGHEPVLAGPPDVGYRLGKFVRRHRIGVSFALVLAVALGGFVAMTMLSTRRVSRERDRATAQAYRANLVVAVDAIAAGRPGSADAFLTEAPAAQRGWEWRHLQGRLDASVRRFDAPGGEMLALAVSADGRSFVTGAADDTLLYRDAMTGAVLRAIQAPGIPYDCGMSRDGRMVVAIGGIREEAEVLTRMWVASWSLPGGEPLDEFTLDLAGHATYRLPHFQDRFIAIDVDRRRIHYASRYPNLIAVIDLDRREIVQSRPLAGPQTLAVSRNGKYVFIGNEPSVSEDSLEVFDAETLEPRGRLAGYHDTPVASASSPDGTRFATVHMDGRLVVWDMGAAVAGRAVDDPLFDLDAEQGGLLGVLFTDDGTRLITAGHNRTIVVRDAATGDPLRRLSSPEQDIAAFRLVPQSDEVVSLGLEGSVGFWATERPDPTVLRGHNSFVYAVDVHRDLGLILTAGWDGYEGHDGSFRLWDLESGDPVAAWSRPASLAKLAMFDPRQNALWALSNPLAAPLSRVDHIDLGTGVTRHVHDSTLAIEALIHSRSAPEAWYVSGRALWHLDTDTGAVDQVTSLGAADDSGVAYGRLALSPDGRTLAVSSGHRRLRLYRPGDREPSHELAPHDAGIMGLAFDSAGHRLLSASEDGTVRVWDVRTRKEIARLVGHELGVLAAAFDPSGTRIATGGRDGTLRIWSGDTYDPIVTLTGHRSYIHAIHWQDDGERILTASGDHTVRIWETQPVRERYGAQRERREIVERLTPRIDAWASSATDSTPAGFLATAPDLSARERQVARQILLGRVLGAAPD